MTDSDQQGTALATALHVVGHWPGAKVLPVRGKVPVYDEVPHGSRDATDDPQTIAAWFTGTDYGVAVTGVLAIDGDDLDATFDGLGDDLLEGVQIQGNPYRMTFVFAQPAKPYGDGKHPGGEVKGSGYVVLPPSAHDGGDECVTCQTGPHTYRWVRRDLDGGLPALPASLTGWLDEHVRRQGDHVQPSDEVPPLWLTHGDTCRTVVRQVDEATLNLDKPDVSKHPIMTDATLRLLRLGEQGHAGVGTAIAAVYGAFLTACRRDSPGRAALAPPEFHRALLGAVSRIEADGLTAPEDYGCCTPEPDPLTDDLVFTATPLLAHIRSTAHARRVGPWALLGSALARAVAETPPHIRLPPFVGGDASLNLYVALVDASGAGKSAGHKAAAETFTGMAWARQVPNGSGEGLIASFLERTPKADLEADPHQPRFRLHTNPQVLMYVDEIGQLQVGSQRQGASIDPILRSMWNGEHVGTNNAEADRNRNLPPHSYRLALVAGVQPGLAGSLLSQQATTSGTAQRWLWLPVTDPFTPDMVPAIPPPQTWTLDLPASGVRYITFPTYVRTEVDEARLRVLRGIGVTEEDKVKAHAMLTRMKVAAAVAVLHNSLEVDDLFWRIAGVVMEKSDATRAGVLHLLAESAEREAESRGRTAAAADRGRRKAEGETDERIARRLVKVVLDHHAEGTPRHDSGAGCARSCLTLAIASRDRAYLDGGIGYALDMDLLTMGEDGHFRMGAEGL
jgi:hypothetical protein